VQLLYEEILEELACVAGRYIEWEWDPRTLTGDLVSMREPNGSQVNIGAPDGRTRHIKVPLRALEELIQADFVSEDPSKRTAGFRLYRLNEVGRKRVC
jgi:hypothetical protein